MKKLIFLFPLIVLVFCGCSREDDTGTVSFWTKEQSSYITVSINGTSKQITKYYPDGLSTCGQDGNADFDLPYGTYSYTISKNGEVFGTGEVSINSSCLVNRLVDGTPRATFWTKKNYGVITVMISGQSKTITNYFPNGISSCDQSGTATFVLSPGQYNITATSSTKTWSGITTISDGCNKIELE